MHPFHNPASSYPGISTRLDQFPSCVDGSSQLGFQEQPGTFPLQSSKFDFRSPIHGDMQLIQEVPLSPSTTSTCRAVPLVMTRSPATQNALYWYIPGVDQSPSPFPLYCESNPTSVLGTPLSQLSFPILHDDQSRGLLFTEYGCKVEQRICTGDGTLTIGNSVDDVSRLMFQKRPKKKVASPEVIKASSMRRKIPGPAKYKCPRDGCGQDFTRNANLDNHLRSHDDIQKFRCSKCGRKLRSSLKRHEDKCRGSDVI